MRKMKSLLLKSLCAISILIAFVFVMAIVIYIFAGGIPYITPHFLFGENSTDNPSIYFAIITTLEMVGLSLLIAVPIGVCSAIYLCEYAKRGSKTVKVIGIATETLAGIPSIIYGLFGALFFGTFFNMGYSVLCGTLTITIMILPTIIRTTEESIRAVPDSYREGSFGLGAGKLRTIRKIVLPSASRGIFTSIVLSVGRIIGETAALIFTLGTVNKLPGTLFDSGRTLAVHMYISTRDGGMTGRNIAFATGSVLIILVVVINIIATLLGRKAGKNK